MPQTGLTTIVGALALTGVWPFSGFFSKEAILVAVYESGFTLPFLALVVTVFLTAVYAFRMVFLAFFGSSAAGGVAHDPPLVMGGPLWVLAVFSVALGPFAESFSKIVLLGGAGSAGHKGTPEFLSFLSLSLALAGIGFAWLTYQRGIIRVETATGGYRTTSTGLWSAYFWSSSGVCGRPSGKREFRPPSSCAR